jgi:class 3 adenylate cyclase/CHASE2 domain-containing sensor protein
VLESRTDLRGLARVRRSFHLLAHQRWTHFLLIACLAVSLSLMLYHARWWVGEVVDHRVLDTYFEARGSQLPRDVARTLPNTRDIVLVETNHTVPRPLLGKLLYQLRYAKVVAFDMMFVDQLAELDRDEKPFYRSYIPVWRRETQALANAVRAAGKTTKVVIGTWPEQQKGAVQDTMKTTWQRPAPMLLRSTPYLAHLTVEPSPQDGVVRHVRLFENTAAGTSKNEARNATQKTPCLGLAVAATALGLTPREISKLVVRDGFLVLKGRRVPVVEDDLMLINYVGGRGCFEHLENRIMYPLVLDWDPQIFKDKIIIIGEVSLKAKEITSTPFGLMPSMQVHANIVASLLDKSTQPAYLPLWQVTLIALACSLLLVPPLLRWPLWASFLTAGAQIFLLVILGAWIFSSSNKILPVSIPLQSVLLTYTAIALYEYRRAWSTLGKFIGTAMMRQILRGVFVPLHLGGREEEATAFFCDLRGYTSLTEQLPLNAVSRLANEYTSALVDVVKRHQGRPIDYQGDGVFVLFERPLAGRNHAEKAVRAALEFQEVFQELRARWDAEGAPPLENGIGIASGTMMIGIVGAEEYVKLGAQGDPVNVAAHIQRLSRECGYRVLLTREVHEQVRHSFAATYEYCGRRTLKERNQPVEVYGVALRGKESTADDALGSNEEVSPNDAQKLQAEMLQ